MKTFPGFPQRPQYVAIPRVFFSDLLPAIQDTAELLVTLHLFRLLGAKRGYPRAILLQALTEDRPLAAGFTNLGRDFRAETARGLEATVARGAFLQVADPQGQVWLLLNSAQDRRAAAALGRGTLKPPPGGETPAPLPVALPPRDIFTLYEETIGPLTPLVAERLQEAEQEYPAPWVQEAFQRAVEQNVRKWSYVEAILQRWQAEGKDHGTPGGHPKKAPSFEEKYLSGPYGRLLRDK